MREGTDLVMRRLRLSKIRVIYGDRSKLCMNTITYEDRSIHDMVMIMHKD